MVKIVKIVVFVQSRIWYNFIFSGNL